jgi:hypothetical protein
LSGVPPNILSTSVNARREESERSPSARLEIVLGDGLGAEGVEVGVLNRSGLLEEGLALEVGWDELGALVWVFFLEVAADCTALVQDETIVILRNWGK